MDEIFVFDCQSDRRTERLAVPDAGQYLNRVGLDLHPTTASIALLTPPKLVVYRIDIDGEPRWNALNDGDESLAVRFARCCESKKHIGYFTAETLRRRRKSERQFTGVKRINGIFKG